MDNSIVTFVEGTRRVLRITARRRWLALGAAATVAVACAIGILQVPERYEASTRVFVDTQTVLKPLMAGLTYQPDMDQQVQMLARTLVSRSNVETLVRTPGLQLDPGNDARREAAVARLMQRIQVTPTATGNLYEISYRGTTPTQARRVVQAMIDLFMHAGVDAKKRDSQDAGRFIEQQIHAYEVKLAEAEDRLKEFKLRNFAVSGISSQDYFLRVSTMGDEVSRLRVELGAVENAREAYRRELSSEDPQLPLGMSTLPGSAPVVDADTRLEEQRRHLDELLRRYTDAHPDVVATRRVIVQLEAEARERRTAEATAGGRLRRAATSPIYQKLRVSLAETEAQIASLRSQLASKHARLDETRALAVRLPQAEAELAQLNRDYDVIRKNYDQMVARRESAALGEKLDATAQLAEFRLIEPPRAGASPVFPGRVHLAVLAALVAAIAGVAAAVFANAVRPTFEDAASLRSFSKRPVLGAVSRQAALSGPAAAHAATLGFATLLTALIVLQAAWVAWLVVRPGAF
jgi:polysaccharide chain length determinant protein (PEP-CTERM system associated)